MYYFNSYKTKNENKEKSELWVMDFFFFFENPVLLHDIY